MVEHTEHPLQQEKQGWRLHTKHNTVFTSKDFRKILCK